MYRHWDIHRQADTALEKALHFTYESDPQLSQYHETAMGLYLVAKGWADDAKALTENWDQKLLQRYDLILLICEQHVALHMNRIDPPKL